MERRSRVRMDSWRMGSGKASASHAVTCLSPCVLKASQSAVGMGLASQGSSSGWHIQSSHMALQRGLTWPALNLPQHSPAVSLPPSVLGEQDLLDVARNESEINYKWNCFWIINEFQGLFILLDYFICFNLFLAQTFCPVLQVKEVMMQPFPYTRQGPPLTWVP